MRLTCDLEIVNRLAPQLNLKSKSRSCRTELSIGKKPGTEINDGDTIYMMLCTKNEKNGQKYKIKSNVVQIFSKFIDDGKATIRFNEPQHDVLINKALALNLKNFLTLINKVNKGIKFDDVLVKNLTAPTTKQLDNLICKMAILDKKKYPLTIGFPSSLKQLIINNCKLKRFDSRILNLKFLSSLNLNDNCIHTIPKDIGKLINLSDLSLSNNEITEIPIEMCSGILSNTLQNLDLSHNKVVYFKPYFCQLQSLVNLRLDSNELKSLPSNFGTLLKLKSLSASKNQLKCLPASFKQLRLYDLDITENQFLDSGPSSMINRLCFLTLEEIVSRMIKDRKIDYNYDVLSHILVTHLNNARFCLCGKSCFQSYAHILNRLNLSTISKSVTRITNENILAPAEAFLCSKNCMTNYELHPDLNMWRRSLHS